MLMRTTILLCLFVFNGYGQGRVGMDTKKTVVAVLPLDAVALTSRQGIKVTVLATDSTMTRTVAAPGLFEDQSSIAAFAEAATQKIVNAFVNVKRLTVVERSVIDKILKEQDFQLTDFAKTSESIRIGGLLGAEYILQGQLQQVTVTELDNRDVWGNPKDEPAFAGTVELNLRLVNVSTGEITASKDVGGETGFWTQPSPSEAAYWALNQAEQKTTEWLRTTFPVEGFVLEVRKEKKGEAREVVITCGKSLGVRKGDKFKVFTEQLVEIDGRQVPRSEDVGKLEVKKTEQDGNFSRCEVEKGGKSIMKLLADGVKLKVVQIKK